MVALKPPQIYSRKGLKTDGGNIMANYVKLIALGTAVATVGAITIGTFASQDTEIKQAVDNLKEMGL